MDWERTRAFATTPTSNGIYIVRAGGGGRGVPDAEYHAFRQRLVDELRAEKDPGTGEPLVARIDTREEAFAGPLSALAPDLSLTLADGGLVSILPSDRIVTPRAMVAGSHRPLGVFMARSKALRRGVDVGELSILDVAPLVLHGLGHRVADAVVEHPLRERQREAAGGGIDVKLAREDRQQRLYGVHQQEDGEARREDRQIDFPEGS